MYGATRDELQATLAEIRDAGLFKDERELSSPQAARVRANGREVLNFCANNYLGLADHPQIVAVHLRHPDPAHGTRGPVVVVPAH
jgi:glycine C-acetyltransferase